MQRLLAVAGSVMSAATASRNGSGDGLMVRELAITAQSRLGYPATSPAPMPREAPVMMATLRAVMAGSYATGGGFAVREAATADRSAKMSLYAERPVVSRSAPGRA